MARVDSGHETVTSEDEEDSITPKHSPVSLIESPSSTSSGHINSSNELKPFCNECKLSSRRFPITCESDLYRVTSCKHDSGTPFLYNSVPQNYQHRHQRNQSASAFEERNTEFQSHSSHLKHPPKLTDSLNHDGKAIIRPIAFKPTDKGSRFLVSGILRKTLERHNSENVLKRNSHSRLSLEHTPFSQKNINNAIDSKKFGGSLCNVLGSSPTEEEVHIKRIGSAFHIDTIGTTSLKKFDSTQTLCLDATEWTQNEINTKGPKHAGWDTEMKHLQAMYEVNLKTTHQRAVKLEQALASNSCQFQQERRKYRAQLDETIRRSEQCDRINAALSLELDTVRNQLEEAEWALCHRAGELALLKAQLKDSQGDQATRSHEMAQLKTTLKELAAEAGNARSKLAQCTLSYRSKERENMILRQSLMQEEKNHKYAMEENFILRKKLKDMDGKHSKESSLWEAEKIKWADEQRKVLRYQKALQHNYIVTCQKAQNLALQLGSYGITSNYHIPSNPQLKGTLSLPSDHHPHC